MSISQIDQRCAIHLAAFGFTWHRLGALEYTGKSAYNAVMPADLSFWIERSKRKQVRACIFNKIG
jgi:hypothetical protein